MAISLAPLRPPVRDRADARAGRRRIARWLVPLLLLAGALAGIATPALAATQATQATQATHATQVTHPAHATQASRQTHPSRPIAPATLTAAVTPALPTGVCQVPGIGDIGGLVGLCSSGSSGILGAVNNICEPSVPQPEPATGGINAMIEPPATAAAGRTLYDSYGIAGQFWAAHGLQCSDMTSLIGNNVAGMVFDAAKSMDRVTITVYQSAAGNNILTWLQNAVNRLISALGNAIYVPYLAPVVILGAIWLAWQGLIRKRASRTIEGTLWMVVACAAAIALIGRPADFTGVGTTVSNGATEVLNTAFAKLPAPAGSNCLPVQPGDPQAVTSNYAFTSGNGLVDENANELWSVLVCKPWLYGEFGITAYTNANGTPSVVGQYGRQLLWSQAIASTETSTTALISAKQATYTGIANSIQQNDPGVYALFQGNQWTTRLEIAFGAVFAALVAGLLILLIALTLIVLKLGFLLLLVAGPFFLIVGTHPGFGRVIAIRWFEMLVGVLMKQVAIAIVLSVLLYCYSLIMGTSDAVLPWALKILMIALVTVAVFIYRKPFQHLFSAVGYGTIGSSERADYSLREAGSTFRRSTLDAATVAVPGVAGYRAARWARRNPGQAAALAAGVASGVGAGAAASSAASAEAAVRAGTVGSASSDAYASRLRPDAPPPADGDAEASPGSRRVLSGAGGAARTRNLPETDSGGGRTAPPPLDLPPRPGSGGSGGSAGTAGSAGLAGAAGSASGWSRGGRSAAPGPVGPRTRAVSTGGSAGPRPAAGGSAPPITRSNGASLGGASRSTGGGASRSSSGGGTTSASGGTSRSSGSRSGGSRSGGQPGPAWPASSWPAAGARSRSASVPKPNPAPAAPAAPPSSASPAAPAAAGESASPPRSGGAGPSAGPDDQAGLPFWLRPVRRDK
jgi:hypothetical protein